MYYPVVKLSNAEMGAVSSLKKESKKGITPIIESKIISQIDEWQATFRTLGTYLSEKLGEIRFIYDFHSAFEKIGEIKELKDEESNLNLVEHCIKKLNDAQLNFLPCIHFDAPPWVIESVLQSNKQEIAVRIRCHDFSSPIEEVLVQRINDQIISQAPDKKFTILLDFYDSAINTERITTSINNFSSLKAHQTVLILTSCPENADTAAPNEFSLIRSRNDIKTYFKLKKIYPKLKFGDYTVRLKPAVDRGRINYYNTYLKIFYSSEDDYYIGKSTLLENKGIDTFRDICQEIINSDVYKKPHFSAGDKAIDDCARGIIQINNHQKPIKYGINHHMELTLKQL